MNTMMRKVIAFLLCFVLFAGCLPANVWATESATEGTTTSEATEVTTAPTQAASEGTEEPSESTEPSTAATEPEVIGVTGITLDVTNLEVGVGAEPVTLTATVTPENVTNKTVTWASSEPGVASVADGVVTFGYIGEAVITATAGEFSATCAVTVGESESTAYGDNTIYVLAGSDFQHPNGAEDSAAMIKTLSQVIKNAGYTNFSSFLYAGDYVFSSHNVQSDTENGINALMNAITSQFSSITKDNTVLVQGNHDYASSLLSPSGNNDTADYGVYVIHEDEYMDTNSSEPTIKATGEKLNQYLQEKINEGYEKPIFVISHLPLHYGSRTARNGDAKYAHYLFDPMQEAGEAGLNIIYLYGHNHAYGYDNYLGGYAVYLPEGDQINIAVSGSTNSFTAETLNFTYMNAGFTGYHCDVGYQTVNAERLSMTVFAITEGQVKVHRFGKDGEMNLKAVGVKNGQYDNLTPDSLVANTDVYGSPQYVTWPTRVTVIHEPTGISVRAYDLTSLEVTVNSVTVPEGYGVYASYNILPVGYTQGDVAIVNIPVDSSFDVNKPVVVLDQGKIIAISNIVDGQITFNTNHFSTYDIGQFAETDWTYINSLSGYAYELDDDGWDYGTDNMYIIVGDNEGKVLGANPSEVINVTPNGDTIVLPSRENEYYIYRRNTGNNWNPTYSYYWRNAGGQYLYHSYYEMYLADSRTQTWTVTHNGNGNYTLLGADGNGDWRLNYDTSHDDFRVANSGVSVRLYKYAGTAPASDVYAQLRGQTTYTVDVGTSQTSALNIVKLGVAGYRATSNTGANETLIPDDQLTWDVEGYNGNAAGTYTVNISYNGVQLGTARIIVEPKILDQDPVYPNPGAVQVDKTATGLDFQNTGLARVELSTSGLPAGQGADVVIVVDTSTSMTNNKIGDKTRLQVLQESMETMIDDFNRANPTTGKVPDIHVAIIDFNGYGAERANLYGSIPEWGNTDYGKVYTGDGTWASAGAFVDASDLLSFNVATQINQTHSGTNYDDALKRAYYLLQAKASANEQNGETRDQYVIFLSDGAPFGWNGIIESDDGTTSGTENNEAYSYYWWNKLLQGEYKTLAELDAAAYAQHEIRLNTQYEFLYNGNGETNPHRWAEAIKGNPTADYTVFDKDKTAGDTAVESDLFTVKGMGATIYSIGFGLKRDSRTKNGVEGAVEVDTMTELLQTIASEDAQGKDLYWPCDSADDLTNAFSQIVTGISYAASNARFVDAMGESFDLQMNPTVKTSAKDAEGNNITKKEDTSITVTSYPVYTKEDVTAGNCTSSDIGKSYGDGELIEKVTFTSDTAATSSALSDTNIIKDGVICAKTFFYNTTSDTKTITLKDGSTYKLAGETFYWDIGTINEKKFVLSYVVYLTNSLEDPGVAEGSYDTNGDAILHYTNYLGTEMSKGVESPNMAWSGANVSYAFYLVDVNGNPLNADGTPADNFLVSYKVTQPVLYETVKLNSQGETVLSAVADDVLPEGYVLYDPAAVYTVKVASGSGGGSWTITGDNPASTYVVGYGGADDYSNAASVNENTYDYTHTTVYFAVKWIIGTVPDAVVIDYGIPVDIHVMANDMLGTSGKLTGVGETSTTIGTTYGGTYGNVTLNVDDSTGLYTSVRYTPKGMIMDNSETFVYQVQYNNSQYYYGEVTVIPATTIYYEDNFVTLTTQVKGDSGWVTNKESGWIDAESKVQPTDKVQDEDRVGEYSLPNVDANNLYGYDSAYASMSEYSLGSAAMVNVRSGNRAKATFEFYGTGFDVISLTSNKTGSITVNVFEWKNGAYDMTAPYVSYAVDTYYGYSRTINDNGETVWTPVDSNSPNALYQVPVMKVAGLTYGKYKVEIVAAYASIFDHEQYDNESYDFYLDAIRVYDPAGDAGSGIKDNTVGDAYMKDGELYPNYFELRDQLIAAKTFDAVTNDAVTGIVFIDGATTNGADETNVIADYKNFGPNNELYLAPGQAVSFVLNAGAVKAPEGYGVDTVQIALKTVGGTGSVKIWDAASATVNTTNARTISTATDLYYDISGLNGKNVVILNSSDADGAIVSITNIKVTYKAVVAPADNSDLEDSIFSVSRESAGIALMSLRRMPVIEEPTEPETEPTEPGTEPTEPETEPTEPETEPTEPETEPTEPETEPTEPETEPTEPETEPTEPETEPTEPETEPTEPETEPTEPETEPTEPETEPTESEAEPTESEAEPTEPEAEPTEPETEPTEPDIPEEPEFFEPGKLNVYLSSSSVKVGNSVVVTVTTSADVQYLTVNGKAITRCVYSRWTGTKTWVVTVDADTVGEMEIDVVAYNAAGLASETVTNTVTVTGNSGSLLEKLFGWLFG